jgi:hypothetical protein
MRDIIVLSQNDDKYQIEEIERNRFIKDILEQLNIDVSHFWVNDEELTIEQRKILREVLTSNKINIIEEERETEILINNKKIAKWKKPIFRIKRNIKEPDRKKRFIVEMEVSYYSIFE